MTLENCFSHQHRVPAVVTHVSNCPSVVSANPHTNQIFKHIYQNDLLLSKIIEAIWICFPYGKGYTSCFVCLENKVFLFGL